MISNMKNFRWTSPIKEVLTTDGDTIEAVIDRGYDDASRMIFRFNRINAYETRLGGRSRTTPAQKRKGLAGKRYLAKIFNDASIILVESVRKEKPKRSKSDNSRL